MIECGSCPFAPEWATRREMTADIKVVYYRGRYCASTAWCKVGRDPTSEEALVPRCVAGSIAPSSISTLKTAASETDSTVGDRMSECGRGRDGTQGGRMSV